MVIAIVPSLKPASLVPKPGKQVASLGRLEDLRKFVNREKELAELIKRAIKEVVVGVCGDAGIGKSSLLEKLAKELEERGHDVLFLRFDDPEMRRHRCLLRSRLSQELFRRLPARRRKLASFIGRPVFRKALAAALVSVTSAAISYSLVASALLSPMLGFVFSVVLLPMLYAAIKHTVIERLRAWSELVLPPPPSNAGRLEVFICENLEAACPRTGKLIIIVDDLSNIHEADRAFLLDLMRRIARERRELAKRVCFIFGWRIGLKELGQPGLIWLIPFTMELQRMDEEGIQRIFSQEGVVLMPPVRARVHELLNGNPGAARAAAKCLMANGIDRVDEHVLSEAEPLLDDINVVFIRYLKGLDKWSWLYKSLALLGASPEQLKALQRLATKYFLVEEDLAKISEGLEVLAEAGIIRYDGVVNACIIVPEALRELIYEGMEPEEKWKMHYLLSSYYEERARETSGPELLRFLDAVANHTAKARRIREDKNLAEREFRACMRLAELYFKVERDPEALAPCVDYVRRAIEIARRLGRKRDELRAIGSLAYYAVHGAMTGEEIVRYVERLRELLPFLCSDQKALAKYAIALSYLARAYAACLGYGEEAIRYALSLLNEALEVVGASEEERAIDDIALWLRAFGIIKGHRGSVVARLYGEHLEEGRRDLIERLKLVELHKEAYVARFGWYEYYAAMSSVNFRLGDICLLEGKLQDALAHYEEHLYYERKKRYPAGLATAMYRRAMALLHVGEEPAYTLDLFRRARRKLYVLGVTKYRVLCDLAMGLILASLGRDREALEILGRARGRISFLEHRLRIAEAVIRGDLNRLLNLCNSLEYQRNLLDRLTLRAVSVIACYMLGTCPPSEALKELEAISAEANRWHLGILSGPLYEAREVIERGFGRGNMLKPITRLLIQPY